MTENMAFSNLYLTMPNKERTSFQEKLRRKRQESFVGRAEQLDRFHANLALPPDADDRIFIFDVFGQGGVGKTSLLQRFRRIVEQSGTQYALAWTDEEQTDIPAVMSRISEQLNQQGYQLKSFEDRYRVYKQRRQELESDPDASKHWLQLVAGATGTLTKTGVLLAQLTPAGPAVKEFVDADALATHARDFATYLGGKFERKDAQLVLSPVDELTPIFIQGLNLIPEDVTLALFFDTYERTGNFLDTWLRGVLEGKHGDLLPSFVLSIAGQIELNKNSWSPFEGVLSRVELAPFCEEEAKSYLNRQGITEAQTVEVILALSGCLPLLLATLAAGKPQSSEEVEDPTDTAVERFLKWEDDPAKRELALNASLPRRLDLDVLKVLVGPDESEAMFEWLRSLPFVKAYGHGWKYHDLVREQMLRHLHNLSKQRWYQMHCKLATHYKDVCEQQQNDTDLDKNEIWHSSNCEWLYHHILESPSTSLSVAINEFVVSLLFNRGKEYASSVAAAMLDAWELIGDVQLLEWGKKLESGARLFLDENATNTEERLTIDTEARIKFLSDILDYPHLEQLWRPLVIGERGRQHLLLDRLESALADSTKAISIRSDFPFLYYQRAMIQMRLESNTQALNDFERLLQLEPDHIGARANKAIIHARLEDFKSALVEIDLAIKSKPNDPGLILIRAKLYGEVGQVEDSLRDFNNAIALAPKRSKYLYERGLFFKSQNQYEAALSDFYAAIQLSPEGAHLYQHAGLCLIQMNRNEDAILEFTKSLEIEKTAGRYYLRGHVYNDLEKYQEALCDYDACLSTEPNHLWALIERAEVNRELERLSEALQDLNRAAELEPENSTIYHHRAGVLVKFRRLEEALVDRTKRTQLEPEDALNWEYRGQVLRLLGRYQEAQADYNKAVGLAPNSCKNEQGLVLTHLGEFEEAISYFEQDIEERQGDLLPVMYNRAVAVARWKGIQVAKPLLDQITSIFLEHDVQYGLAGMCALAGNEVDALIHLREAIKRNAEVAEWAKHDVAWRDLWQNPRFLEVVA